MLELATSYFYHIRFFKPYMIPLSTAIWDPKWYHNFREQDKTFIDKNGVINGLRISPLMPGSSCDGLCRGREVCSVGDPSSCEFLKAYYKQLSSISMPTFMSELNSHIDTIVEYLKLDRDPLVVFIVHEKYDNPCSERVMLHKWFKENSIKCEELIYPVQHNY